MNQQEQSDLKKKWEEFVFDLTEYTPIHFQSILQNFNKDFIAQLPFISKNLIREILL